MALKEEIKEKLDILLPNTSKEMFIYEYKKYLSDTDYVVIKMYETAMQGGSISDMLEEYKEVLFKREEARNLINALSQASTEE
jgi:hypothetical protein